MIEPKAKRVPLGPVGERVRENIRRAREVRGVTYVELSERLIKLGRPIPPLGLSRLEAGERRVDVDDLVAIVRALNLPSVADELMPQMYAHSDPVQVTPTLEMAAGDAWRLFSGERPPVDPFAGIEPVKLARLIEVLKPVGEAAQAAVANGALPNQISAWAEARAVDQLKTEMPQSLNQLADQLRVVAAGLEEKSMRGKVGNAMAAARRLREIADAYEKEAAAPTQWPIALANEATEIMRKMMTAMESHLDTEAAETDG